MRLRSRCFSFCKQKTAYEIYQCDWSSDVCSSDLAGTWRATGSVTRTGDALIALSCGPDLALALTSDRLIDLAGAIPALTLSARLRPLPLGAVVHVTPDAAWLGIDAGEWGGGLSRIDRHTGAVT